MRGWRSGCYLMAALLAAGSALAEQETSLEAAGRVVTREGVPAANVAITLEVSDMRVRHQIGYERTQTGPDGAFTINLDKYSEIPSLGLQFNTLSPRFRDAVKIVVAKTTDFPVQVELTVDPGSVAKGVVVDDQGKGLEGAEITTPGSRATTTSADGSFEIFGLPAKGTTTLTASKSGYITLSADVGSEEASLIEGLRIVLTPAAELKGKVVDPLGEPVGEGMVLIMTEKELLRKRISKDGTFIFRAAPRDLTASTVDVKTKNYIFQARNFRADESTSQTVTLRVEWPLALTGQVLSHSGEPYAGASIAVERTGEAPQWFPVDADGNWRALPFEPGKPVTLTALPADPMGRRASGELEFLRETKTGSWDAEVNPWPRGFHSVYSAKVDGRKITMSRRDSGLGSLPGEIIYEGEIDEHFQTMKGTMTVAALAAKGEWTAKAYEATGTLSGIWDLRETIGNGEYLQAPVRVAVAAAPMSGDQVVDLKLSDPQTVSGTVLDEGGNPVPEGLVRVIGWDGSRILDRRAPIEVGGRFKLGGLPDGVLQLVAVDGRGKPVSPLPLLTRGGVTDALISAAPSPDDPMDYVVEPVSPSPTAAGGK